MSVIKTLKQKNENGIEESVYPKTTTKAVVDSETNETLDVILDEMNDKIDNIEISGGVIDYDNENLILPFTSSLFVSSATYSTNGVSFKLQQDNSILVSGTATADGSVMFWNNIGPGYKPLQYDIEYSISGLPLQGSEDSFYLKIVNSTYYRTINIYDTEFLYTPSSADHNESYKDISMMSFCFKAGQVFTNFVLKPMIIATTSKYYESSNGSVAYVPPKFATPFRSGRFKLEAPSHSSYNYEPNVSLPTSYQVARFVQDQIANRVKAVNQSFTSSSVSFSLNAGQSMLVFPHTDTAGGMTDVLYCVRSVNTPDIIHVKTFHQNGEAFKVSTSGSTVTITCTTGTPELTRLVW